MGENQVIEAPVTNLSTESHSPAMEFVDYPFDILLDISPTEEILDLIFSEGLSNLPDVETTEAEILVKPLLRASGQAFFYAGIKLRWTDVDGKKLQKWKVRPLLNKLAEFD